MMHPRWRSLAILLLFVAVSPAQMAPSCDGATDPKTFAKLPPPETQPPAGLGPTYRPIAVGAFVAVSDSAVVVDGDAFVVDRSAGVRLHAVKPGTSTVRYDTSDGRRDVTYRALVADTINVPPGWCGSTPSAGAPCLVGDGDELHVLFTLFSGGLGGTILEPGDLPVLTLPPFLSATYASGEANIDVEGDGHGDIGSPLDPSLALPVESVAVTSVDSLTIELLPDAAEVGVRVHASVGGRALDADRFVRHVTVDTPAACALADAASSDLEVREVVGDGSEAMPRLALHAKAGGPCTIHASLLGSTLTATATHAF